MSVNNLPSESTRHVAAEDSAATWRAQRTEHAQHQAEELARRQARETAQARELLLTFIAAASDAGLEPSRLTARGYKGKTRYKTNLFGWYLKQNRSVAVDTEGNFYVLSVQDSVLGRFTGVQPTPSDPPLVLGLGGRDGESLDLTEAIDRLLHPENY
ncbi:hypothetical protein [Timonella sp. A28]|uniref:hypothetical protein n=1 Tax=Timonella sp. A28 TaxID=3442640 RepID=UPI003EC01BB0